MLAANEAKDGAPFRSLTEVRAAHANLMREVRKAGDGANVARVADFVKRAQDAGAVIEGQNDRDAAQGILDYWAAWQFSQIRGSKDTATPPTLAEFVPSVTLQRKPAENPFVGLRAFDEKDAGYFIGREEATRSLLDKVQRHRMVFVNGPLGSGKTSLVFAGIVPRLRSRAVLETKKEPVFPLVIPGFDPLAALLRAVLQVAITRPADTGAWLASQQKKLQRSPDSLGDIVKEVAPEATVVLIVDQFEEIFTLCTDAEAREQFTKAIAALAESEGSPNRAILIIRDDYAQQTFAMAALKGFAEDTDTRFTPPQLTVAELARSITSAADAVGLKFDDGLVEELAQDAAGDAATLPTLQFTLSRLWAALPPDSNRITYELCRQIGKPRVALAQAAEAAFQSLSKEDQEIAKRQFLELVQPTIGKDVRRRRVPLDNLVQLTGDSAARIEAVLSCFEQAELVRRTKGAAPGEDRFEVAHEALVTSWRRLDDWLNVGRQEMEKKLQLITTARLWRESGQSPGYLLTGDAIKDALPYAPQAPEIRDLIDASERSARRYAWRQSIIGTALAVIFAIIMTFYGMTFFNRKELRKNFDERDVAVQKLDVQSQTLADQLRVAQDTITQQQREIERLRQQLRLPPALESPVRPPTPTEDLSSAGMKGWIWIGSESDPNLRDAQNAAVLPSSAVADGRYILARNVVLRSEKPSDTYAQSQSLGLVLIGMPVTATGPAIAYDRPSGTKQYWLPVRVDRPDKPIVYYQYANIGKSDAQQLADTIQSKGYRIPEIQTFDSAKGMNEVRYFYPDDRRAAVKLAADVTLILKDRHSMLSATKVVDLTATAPDKNFPGVLELWLDPTSH